MNSNTLGPDSSQHDTHTKNDAVVMDAVAQQAVDKYNQDRRQVLDDENAMAYDHQCRLIATKAEWLADAVIQRLKVEDKENIFAKTQQHAGHGNQMHPHFPGDHFLTNEALIGKTQLLWVAKHMPKGSHLHIHFNSCLLPNVLLDVAKGMDRMFIMSTKPLVPEAGNENFFLCDIQFSILSVDKENPGNIFSPAYLEKQTMRFQDFLAQFPSKQLGISPMDWLASKLVFSEEEAYDIHQTVEGAWERFNGRTGMMKGLFNYVTAYRKYIDLFLQNLLDDNIQYAEIRPNFMKTNQLWDDKGLRTIENDGIVEIIVEACKKFKAREHDKHFDGIKIIYCTPRSLKNTDIEFALAQCLEFKQLYPDYIAGFDLVGEEAKKKYPLKQFIREFLAFQRNCKAAGVEIPFLFHCGETLDIGTEVDGNLVDALLLGSKRIGHGFALPRHPHIMQEMKKRDVCVEVCPISNEILGLTPRISGHSVFSLLANNVPCTVNSDNGTLFKSTLSHDFYQLMVGKADMTIFGWRQLAEWSLKHACMSESELKVARKHWHDAWCKFVVWLLKTYDSANPETQKALAEIKANTSPASVALCW